MKCIDYFLNRLHFGFFECHKWAQLFACKTVEIPIEYIAKTFGLNIHNLKARKKIVHRTLVDPKTSTISYLSEQSMIIVSFCLECSFVNFLSILFPQLSLVECGEIEFVVLLGVPAFCLNYFSIIKDDRYLVYYKIFEKAPARTNLIWRWAAFLSEIISVALLVLSFIAMSVDN